ncbi:MAG: carboxypeptidase regulatory-like domain-containing protein [Pyrinomonadaceae bacterium]
MRRALTFALSAVVIATLSAFQSTAATSPRPGLATITGSVHDQHGNPLPGALVSLLRDGAKRAAKEAFTDNQGNFIAKVTPGRYVIKAMAQGFGEVVFSSVEVRASQELVYRFNLEPVGYGKTLPERRRDREDAKWTLRSAQSRRSIFQVDGGEDSTIAAVEQSTAAEDQPEVLDPDNSNNAATRTHGVLESFIAYNGYASSYRGLNFAVSTPVSERVDVIIAGQTGVGTDAPERFEASSRIRVADRHKVDVTAAGIRLGTPLWGNKFNNSEIFGQVSLRAVDEWIVRDGIVILMGVDYSRFMGRNGAHALTPRFGVQFDANARTRVRAAFAAGDGEDGIQSVANFEDGQVVFREQATRPVAFVDGQALMERSHRLEFGIERVLDNNSNLEATAFFDTTSGRGVGLMMSPMTGFTGSVGAAFMEVANQRGTSRGLRLVYTRRLNRMWTASAGYSFGRGQKLSEAFSNPADLFKNGFFQTAALQLGAGFRTGTQVRTVVRFSPEATVFAIDPFAGRLGVYDPSLSIQVTQELPSFGLPLRAEAMIDARNLLDNQATAENGDVLTLVGNTRRSVRGGISLRF